MSYLGDIRLGDTIDFKFCTTAAATGAPTTLAGSPVVSAYPGNSTTELTAGITLTVDFDSRTGMHNCRVVATGGNGYATNTNYTLVLTAGTVGGTSVVGYVIGEFSIEARSAVMPTVALRTLDVAATGEAGVDFDNILLTNGAPKAGVTASGTLSGTHSTTTADLGANAPGASQIVVGQTVFFPAWSLSVVVTAYNTGTGVITFDTITPTLVDGNVWIMYPSAAAAASTAPTAAQVATAVWQDATAGDFTVASSIGKSLYIANVAPGAAGGHFIAGANAATSIATALTANLIGNITGNLSGSAGSVTGSVGSVTGAVGSVIAQVTANVAQINGTTVLGNGTGGNLWRG